VAVDHVPVDVGLRTGIWRSGAHSYTAFFTECFMDELARQAKIEPMSFRMQMLGANPRLARVLTTAATLGGWDGGSPGSAMGIAAHSAFGSHIAVLVEIEIDAAQRLRVPRAVCAVDVGRVINPDILRQVIEGGIIHGVAGATGAKIEFERGLPTVRSLGALGLPRLADSPEISIEIMESEEEPGGATELGVPAVAPAIGNALFALTGRRVRSLPLA
jgi:isoquinoline 1-oxidoreductase beta subunit